MTIFARSRSRSMFVRVAATTWPIVLLASCASTSSTRPSASATWRGPATGSKRSGAGVGGSGASASTTSGGSALYGPRRAPARPGWRSSTTTDEEAQAHPRAYPPGRDAARGPRRARHERGGACAAHRGTGENRITQILNGRRAVTGDTALRLGRFFGTSGEFWLNLQKLYELRLAERENGAAIAPLPTLDAARDRHAAAPPGNSSASGSA